MGINVCTSEASDNRVCIEIACASQCASKAIESMGFIDVLRPYQFRGKTRLLSPFVPRMGIREAQVFGYKMSLDLGDLIQRNIYLGTYERHETQCVVKLLKPSN